MEITYHVPEVHCGACVASIQRALEKVDGFEQLDADLETRRVTVRFDESRASTESLKAQIERAGFDVE
jgi:copper chaperone CopZ